MEVIKLEREMKSMPWSPGRVAMAIGKFESLHIGHRRIMERLVEEAGSRGIPSAVMVFEPNPSAVLRGVPHMSMLTFEERCWYLERLGIDFCLFQRVDADFMAQTADMFCRRVFSDMNVSVLVVGDGFRFGKDRAGSFAQLESAAGDFGACVVVCEPATVDGQQVSSSALRELLVTDFGRVAGMLGRPFSLIALSHPGRKLGREIGFPTINQSPEGKLLPGNGVYITQTTILPESMTHMSITNIGLRPTVLEATPQLSIETHVLEEIRAIRYSERVMVEFMVFLREEKRYNSMEELREQIGRDCEVARRWHGG